MKNRFLIPLFTGAVIFLSIILLLLGSARGVPVAAKPEEFIISSPTSFLPPTYQPSTIPIVMLIPSATPTPTATTSPTPVPRIGDALPVTHVSVDVSADPDHYEGSCKDKLEFTFTATVTLEKSGTVIYKWLRSDSTETAPQTLSFTEAGTKTVSASWQPDFKDFEFSGWQKMKITTPVEIESNEAYFTILCSL